jgi:hypothetical protein
MDLVALQPRDHYVYVVYGEDRQIFAEWRVMEREG